MVSYQKELEEKIARKFQRIDNNLKASFSLIKNDIKEMQDSIEFIKKYIKNKKEQDTRIRKHDTKIRSKFRKDVDEFTQKTVQLSLTLSEVKKLQNNLMTKKDLAKIEEEIKNDLKSKIEVLEERSNKLEHF